MENQLRLALETPVEVRQQTEDLNVGFDEAQQTWEVIVKYHGNLDNVRNLGVIAEELIAGYAILTASVNLIEAVADLEEIEYMEKPKRFYYSQTSILPREGSCIYPVTLQEPFLTGRGVLAAVLDSGIDYTKRVFRNPNGGSRILYLWDQTLRPSESTNSPEMFAGGVEFTKEQIDAAIAGQEDNNMWITPQLSTISTRDVSGHGTAVSGIFAASDLTGEMTSNPVQNAENEGFPYVGIAPEADFLIVKLGIPGENAFPRTTEIMKGVTYVINKALELNRPVSINLSIGNTYGSHDGTALLERFLDNAAQIGKSVICVGSGNEADSGGHVSGNVGQRQTVDFTVGEYERNLSLQIWKNYSDEYDIILHSPGGREEVISGQIESGKYEVLMEQTRVLVYVGDPTPYSTNQEIYFEFLPASGNSYMNSGVWQVEFKPIRIVTGDYFMYLPSREARSSRTAFLRPTPQATFTIPSTASRVITVGAYDSTYQAYADFSGRGYGGNERGSQNGVIGTRAGIVGTGIKPDIVAPGVGILAPSIYGGYEAFTGTSFATPIVAGAAALLMEWGIVRGNDPYLYGEKVKAYLIRGARELPGFTEYPNPQIGYGALCVRGSIQKRFVVKK